MKSVYLPCSGPVEIGDYLPVLDHPLFQRLRHTRQLGVNFLIFPGAQHTRFEHALGTLARLRKSGALRHATPQQRRDLELFALLHDIGHGPFSHQIEPVLSGDHHSRGQECLSQLAGEISQCGADPTAIAKMLGGQSPLRLWVTDRNLGADKLDYLQRDAFHIGFAGAPDLEIVQQQTAWTEAGLALNEKFIEEGKRLQKFYSYLHQHGYLNKTALVAQRLLQRALHEELRARGAGETATASDEGALWTMTDSQLLAWLLEGRGRLARQLTRQLLERRLPRTAICIKPDGYAYVENAIGKPIAVLTWPRRQLAQFSAKYATMESIRRLENRLADAAGLPEGTVLLAAMPYFTKLLPHDLRIANGGNHDYWLFDQDRDHRASLESDYLRTFAVRIAVPENARARLASQPEKLLELL